MRVEKSWGYEEIIHNGDYCCKKLVYEIPIASSLHYHQHKHETFFVHSGKFKIEIDGGEPQDLAIGQAVILPPGTRHRIRCIEPGMILEASTFDNPFDCVRLIPSEV